MFIRIKRICSFLSDFLYNSGILINQLMSRGYKYSFLRKIQRTVSFIDRLSLLPFKKHKLINKKVIFFKLPFEINKKLDKNSLYSIKNCFINHKFLKDYSIKIIYSRQPNLSRLLVHSQKISNFTSFFNTKCSKYGCKICFIIDNTYNYVKINNFIFPILSNGNCNSVNAIYIIKCNICNNFYIGQTQNIKNRISSHINTILNFSPFVLNSTCVARHFNKRLHNLQDHFSFIIFKENINDFNTRLRLESQLINLVRMIDSSIINKDFPVKRGSHVPLFSICE